MHLLTILCLILLNVACHATKRAVVIGASSGIGRQIAKHLAADGYEEGLVARRTHLLKSLQNGIPTKTYVKTIDVSKDDSKVLLAELIKEMGGLDLILISVSSFIDRIDKYRMTNEIQDKEIEVDLKGFLKMAQVAIPIFKEQKSGHLIGISSINGLRGDAKCPVYCGAKAFIQRYLEGIRNHMIQNNIPVYVTDIVPGWVDIEAKKFSDLSHTYWITDLETAGRQIFEAIKAKKKVAYISKRQILVAWALKLCPDWLYNWMGGF